MTASKLNPDVWKGEERSSGFLFKNKNVKAATSPDWKGRIYLKGVGWYWLSAWVRDARGSPMLALRAQEMSDEDTLKYCTPKEGAGRPKQTTSHERRELDLTDDSLPLPSGNGQSDIPF